MPSPFPGVNPYLEHPERWSTVHNRLIVALADVLRLWRYFEQFTRSLLVMLAQLLAQRL